jgi:hypothetical protein
LKAGRLIRLADDGGAAAAADEALPAGGPLRPRVWARVRGFTTVEVGVEVEVEAAVCEEGGLSVVADVRAVAVDLGRPWPVVACDKPAGSLLLFAAVGANIVVVVVVVAVEGGAWRIEGARPKGFGAAVVLLLFSSPVDVGLARRAADAVVLPEKTPESGRLLGAGFVIVVGGVVAAAVLSGAAVDVAPGRRFEAAVEKMPESGRRDVVVVVVVDEAEGRARVAADDVAEAVVADRVNGLICGSRLGDVFLVAALPLGFESVMEEVALMLVLAGWRSDRVRPSPVEEDMVWSSCVSRVMGIRMAG